MDDRDGNGGVKRKKPLEGAGGMKGHFQRMKDETLEWTFYRLTYPTNTYCSDICVRSFVRSFGRSVVGRCPLDFPLFCGPVSFMCYF